MSDTKTVLMTVAASAVTGGLSGAVVRYLLDTRLQRRAFVLKLHEEWWKEDFRKARETVYGLVENLPPLGDGEKVMPFIEAVRGRAATGAIPGAREFYRLAFFFADLNAAIENGLADQALAYRMFGEAQYLWFEPLMRAVRDATPYNPGIRWVGETASLAERFEKLHARADRRRLSAPVRPQLAERERVLDAFERR